MGKAGKAVTRQVGKALTSIGDSPDRRGVEKVFQITKNQKYNTNAKGRRLRKNTKFDFGLDRGKSSAWNRHSIEWSPYMLFGLFHFIRFIRN